MPLTNDFRATVKAHADRNPAFRAGLYQEAVQTMLDGDLATGYVLLHRFINATIGFLALTETVSLTVHVKRTRSRTAQDTRAA